jgi:4-hydroxythreonine-4-phosphate dehydrogenase
MKKLAITMGDPGGVGPEIIVKALNSPDVISCCRPIIIGDSSVMEKALSLLNSPLKLRIIKSPKESKPAKRFIEIIDIGTNELHSTKLRCSRPVIPARPESFLIATPSTPFVKEDSKGFPTRGNDKKYANRRYNPEVELRGMLPIKSVPKNKPTTEGGKACVSYIRKAVELALKRQVAGIVTAPISKEALKMAGYRWPGHTEMLADLTNTKDYAMMLVGGPLRVILVTIHTALKKVPDLITKQKIVKTICLAKRACNMLRIKNPRIAVAGLNPHAGEGGIFGDEEVKKIIPAVKEAIKEGIPVSGPYPPDTIFHKAYRREIDIVVCMYHDQGLIPLKMIAFDKGVNVTVGLPFIRTSPDHGTAYDIAWKGIADPSSMIEAIKLAAEVKV